MTVTDEPEYVTSTRAAYDTVALSYATTLADALEENPFDRAVLALFADLVRGTTTTGQRVAEIGCGPGRITGPLAALGLDVFGIDLSPVMVAEARRRNPGLEFQVGDMTNLELEPASLAGLVAWYSIIHVPPTEHAGVFAGFRRALAPGGHLMLAFQVGDERRHVTDAYGHSGLSAYAYRLPPEQVEKDAVGAGFVPVARMVREPFDGEKQPQAYLLLRADHGS